MMIAVIEFKMNINDVMEKDISEITTLICNKFGSSLESIDNVLKDRGYTKIFTVDDEW